MTKGKKPFHWVTGEKIALRKDGTWLSDGREITHEQTVDAFARNLKWAPEHNSYIVELGHERIAVDVEEAAFFVTGVRREGQGWVALVSDGTMEPLAPGRLLYTPVALYLDLKRHDRAERAKFLSAPYFEILKTLGKDKKGYFIKLDNQRYDLLSK